MDEESNLHAQVLGNELAKEVIRQFRTDPARDIGLSAAASSLVAASYCQITKTSGPENADRWMVIVLSTVQDALKQIGIEITFSFVRKPA